jgi:hypothetical protein
MKVRDFPANLIFSVDKIRLFWKWMPSHVFISKKLKNVSGFEASEDWLTLLLGSNISRSSN